MWLRRSSVPKCSMVISRNWPELRSMAWRHIFSRSKVVSKSSWLRMSMARHMEGSLQRLRQCMHTFCALSRISITPSLCRIDAVTSLGSSCQFLYCSLQVEEDGDSIFVVQILHTKGKFWFRFPLSQRGKWKMGFSRVWNLGVFENFDSIELNEGRDVSYDLSRFF